jgi:tetratricopeptide (TPR) repeat protein
VKRVTLTLAAAALLGACGGGQPDRLVETVAASSTDRLIARNQALLRTAPNDTTARAALAAGYLQKVREVGDPTYYPKAEALLGSALKLRPDDTEALVQMGALSLGRHRFRDALDWGRRAAALDPYSARALGVAGDAAVELGRYDEAFATFQRMVDLRPDLSSYARVSYARELTGDANGAIESMRAAVAAGGPAPENVAYTQVLLGNLYFDRGALDQAEAAYRSAQAGLAGYVPAQAGLARVLAARGRYDQAAVLYRRAVDLNPAPDYVIALGEVSAAAGDAAGARRAFELAVAQQHLFAANGVDLDREQALFEADHGDPSAALAAARRAMADRPSVHSADALAWALYRAGDLTAALEASQQARRLGTRDALMLFHAGAIEAGLGLHVQAKAHLAQALTINPHFSVLHAPEARQALTALGGMP